MIGNALYEFIYVNDPLYINCKDFTENGFWADTTTRMFVIYGFTFLALVPYCLKKHIGEMALISYLGMTSLLYTIIVTKINNILFIDFS